MIRAVIERLNEGWKEFRESEPGHLFQKRYPRQQVERCHLLRRVFLISCSERS